MKKILFVTFLCFMILPGLLFAQRSTGSTTPMFTLTVTCNVQGAQVLITGSPINGVLQGQTPFTTKLQKEVYKITINAPGYNSQTKSIAIGSDQTVHFDLQPANFKLNITSNIPGARVRIQGGGQTYNGNTNMTIELPPNTYRIAAVAPGYQPQTEQITLNGNQTVNFNLQPLTAKVSVILSPNILNPRIGNPAAQVKVFDNGQLMKDLVLDLNPGQHTIRVETGGFAFEVTLNLEAGKDYKIEPFGGFIVNGQKM